MYIPGLSRFLQILLFRRDHRFRIFHAFLPKKTEKLIYFLLLFVSKNCLEVFLKVNLNLDRNIIFGISFPGI